MFALPICYDKNVSIKADYKKDGDCMPNNAETIEALARKLERVRILNDLKDCTTIEDYQELTKKYENLCNDDKRN